MKKHYFILEHRNPAYVLRLRDQLNTLQQKLDGLRRDYRFLEIKYGAEVQYNAALCDLLRENDIPFRSVFEHDVRYKNDCKRP